MAQVRMMAMVVARSAAARVRRRHERKRRELAVALGWSTGISQDAIVAVRSDGVEKRPLSERGLVLVLWPLTNEIRY